MDGNPDQGGGTPERKRTGIGKYLKRIRSAIRPSNPHKGAKHTDADEAGPAAGRHLESAASFVTTYTYRTKTPEHRNRTPEHRNRTPDLPIRTKTPSLGRRTPSLRTTTPDVPPIPKEFPPLPQDRPSLPEPSVSEGSLIARPIRDVPINTQDSFARSPGLTLERSNSSVFPRSDPRDERSIELFERYGIQLEPGAWAPVNRPATMERVDKEIRMRTHYHCHKCEVGLGPSKICINCGHKKCKKCLRFPVRRHKHKHRHHDSDGDGGEEHPLLGGRREMTERTERSPLLPPRESREPEARTLLLPSEESHIIGENPNFPPNERVQNEKEPLQPMVSYESNYVDTGEEIGVAISTSPLVKAPWPPTFAAKPSKTDRLSLLLQTIHSAHYNPPSAIHVQRICHQCSTPFIRTERTCYQCDHEMCYKCPRDPPRSNDDGGPQWPTGGGGSILAPKQEKVRPERMWKKPRMRVRYTCDHCESLFNEREKVCAGCGHQRCKNCARTPAIKILETPVRTTSPVVLKSLENRLATFAIIDAGAANRTLSSATVAAPLSPHDSSQASSPHITTPTIQSTPQRHTLRPRISQPHVACPLPSIPSHTLSERTATSLPSAPRNEPSSPRLHIRASGEGITFTNRLRTPEPAV